MTNVDPSWCALVNGGRQPAPGALATGSPYVARVVPDRHLCDCCGTPMSDRHCKIVCPNCGYKRDCSDP